MKEKKDKLHSVGDEDGEILVTLTKKDHFIPIQRDIDQLFPEEYFTLFVKCSRCGHVHNINNPCKCGKITDVYVEETSLVKLRIACREKFIEIKEKVNIHPFDYIYCIDRTRKTKRVIEEMKRTNNYITKNRKIKHIGVVPYFRYKGKWVCFPSTKRFSDWDFYDYVEDTEIYKKAYPIVDEIVRKELGAF